MIGLIYFIGLIFYLTYRCFRIESSVLRSDLSFRLSGAICASLLWFLYLPLEIIRGHLFYNQMDYDRVIYREIVEDQIDEAVAESYAKYPYMSDEKEAELREKLRKGIGTLDDALNDCVYFSKSITKSQLAGLICYHFSKSSASQNQLEERYEEISPMSFVEKCVSNLPELTDRIKEDLSFLNLGEGYTSIRYNTRSNFADLLGFHTLKSGLTFYGVEVKSKETIPFYMIVYYDGWELRAFVPPHNLYNKETVEPFGVDEDADLVFLEDSLQESCFKSTMYKSYAKRLSVHRLEAQIEQTVNYLPLSGESPKFGWDDIEVK